MAVYKLKHRDKWIARLVGANGRAVSKTFDRKTDATRWHAGQLAARERGDWVNPRDARTLGEFYADWSARQVWERGTVMAMDLAVRSSKLEDLPLNRIRRSHLESWIKTMVSDGLAPGTVKTRFNNARSVLRAAVRDRVIASDPSDGVVLPRQRRREAAMVLPTVEQVQALLEAADDRFIAFLALCAFAGLRLGEAAGVQADDIDFLRKRLEVRRQIQRGTKGSGIEIRRPKYGSERTVYLPDDLLMILSRHVAAVAGPWLFYGQGDQPPHQDTVGHRWEQTRKRAGVQGFTLHSLRHFFASGLISEGCDVVTVQRAMGHGSAATTLTTYSHLWPTAEDKTRQASANLMAAVSATDRQQDSHTGR